MKAIEIKKDIYWVGYVDYSSLDFHGYSISPQGTTYNNYLIMDEKTVLIDTVRHENLADTLRNIKQVAGDLEKIDYIIVNHVELDHAGCLQEIVKLCKPEKIICSPMGKTSMERYFDTTGWPIEVKKTGDILNIGKRNIQFIEARMIHWPDSMFSYIIEDKILITNDAFGQNIASSERFVDEFPRYMVEHAMSEYYHNIVLPYSPRVTAIIKQLKESKLDVDMIAPDHGLIFRGKQDVNYVLEKYSEYAEQKTKKKALIIFDTMWNSTQKMADAIAEGLQAAGVPVRIINLKQHHHSVVMTELANAGLVIAGSPTHNNTYLPFVASTLTYMKGLRPKNRMGAAFGSYGWSGEGPIQIHKKLESMDMVMPLEPLKFQYGVKEDDLKKCVEWGEKLAMELITMISSQERCE